MDNIVVRNFLYCPLAHSSEHRSYYYDLSQRAKGKEQTSWDLSSDSVIQAKLKQT